MQYARINTFSGLNVTDDTSNAPQNSLAAAENVLIRPAGAARRMPSYGKLWALNNIKDYIIGGGPNKLPLGPSDGTVMLLLHSINSQLRALMAYDCANEKAMGFYFIGGNDGELPTLESLTAGSLIFQVGPQQPTTFINAIGGNTSLSVYTPPPALWHLTGGPPSNVLTGGHIVTISVLKKNLAPLKRWYFSRIYSEIWMGNGVDANLIWNNTRTPMTGQGYGGGGQLREAGTNDLPTKPLVGSVASLPAAAAVQPTASVITAGTSVTIGTSTTVGTSTLTFTADPINFSGTNGHNISVCLISAGTSTAISSTRTGAGTTISPFVYTLTLGTTAAQSSGNAIVSFVTSDYNATGVLTAAVNSPATEANPSLSLAQTALSGGADEVTVGGHPTTMRCTFATTLFDPGPPGSNLGYEGPASALSNEVVGTGSNDFLVTVQQKTGVDARFTKQNIWMLQYVGPAYPIAPDGPFVWRKILTVNNANGSYRIKKDFQSLEVRDSAPDQGRIPPCTMFEFAGDKMWSSGNAAEPYRIWLSKTKTDTEQVPEGCDITSYIDIEGKKEEPSRPRITAIRKLESRVQVHSDRSITMIEATNLTKIVSRSDYGAINPACVASWNRPRIPYLGSDGVLYELNNTQWYRSELSDSKGWPVLRQNVNVQELNINGQRCNMVSDATNDIVFIWLPVGNGASLGCFAMDFAAGALTGPHTCPTLFSSNPVAAGDTRVVGCDEQGYLWVVDFGYLFTDKFSANSAFTMRPAGYAVSSNETGFTRHVFSDGTSIDRSFKCVLETQYLDLQTPNDRKGFYSVDWTVARYTRAIVKVILTSDDGHTKTFDCGEMYGRERNKIAFMMSGNAIKVRFEAIVGEDKPFILRDLTIGYELQTNAGGFFF